MKLNKIQLKRETLRDLTGEQLSRIGGGGVNTANNCLSMPICVTVYSCEFTACDCAPTQGKGCFSSPTMPC